MYWMTALRSASVSVFQAGMPSSMRPLRIVASRSASVGSAPSGVDL
jgi:hypothetical protein